MPEAIHKLAAFSGFVPTNASADRIDQLPDGRTAIFVQCSACITFLLRSMILDGRKMKFASRKRLNQQTKAEKQFSPAMPIHLSKKQTVGKHHFRVQIIEKKWCAR
jgi:hypothetical protein